MKRNFGIWVSIILLLFISLPGIIQRWQVEENNNTYEVAIPYFEIYDLTIDGHLTLDEAFATLKDAGLSAVSLNPLSLSWLHGREILTIYDVSYLEYELQFSSIDHDIDFSEQGYYLSLPEEAYYQDVIQQHFNTEERYVGNDTFLYLGDVEEEDLDRQLGYDEIAMENLIRHDIPYFFRAMNSEDDKELEHLIGTMVKTDIDQPRILFRGGETFGGSDNAQYYASKLEEAGFQFYKIESSNQTGLGTYAKESDYNITRLFSVNLGHRGLEANLERSIRAVKERNIRSLFVHIPLTSPEEALEDTVIFLESLQEQMPDRFRLGVSTPYEPIDIPIWAYASVLLASILFTYIASSVINNHKLQILAAAFIAIVAIGYYLTEQIILLQGIALAVAVLTPIYAVISTTKEGKENLGAITVQYIKALAISLVGILIMVGILNGNEFITGFEIFRAVKLVYIIPIAFVAISLLLMKQFNIKDGKRILTLLNSPVKYWHVLVLILIGSIGFYYISRTGNAGSVAEIELVIRQKLEELLYVRPRTKEFLIGFPSYILALYVMSKSKLWGRLLLIPGVIGFLSIVNTLSHLHIPLSISLLRTVYGVIFGLIIGFVLIYLFRLIYPYLSKALNSR